jgi:nucleoside-diphosphate-sugar epimerase
MNPSSARQPTVLILGANGRLGCAAAQAFDRAGWNVLAQVRRLPASDLPATARVLRANLFDAEALAAHASAASVVVHAISPPYTRWEAEALPALDAGLEIAERLQAHFMLPGNVYNFGESMPPLLREDTAQRPSTRKGEIRMEMEARMARRAARGGIAASVVRAGDFFGAGQGNWLDRVILKSLRGGKLVYPGPMEVRHAWAYLPDLAGAFVRVAAQPAPCGLSATWNFSGHTLTGRELLAAIENAASSLGITPARPFRHARMPWGLIRAGGVVVPMWRELAAMAYLWNVPHGLDGTRLNALEGFSAPTTPLATALVASLRALGYGAPLPRAAPARESS